MSFHKDLVGPDIHIPYRFSYADAAARAAATGFTSDDVGTVALQIDDQSLWLLSATTPTWTAIGGSAGVPSWLVSVSQNSGGQTFTDSLTTPVTFDTAISDTHGFAASPPSSADLTIPADGAGTYLVQWEIDYPATIGLTFVQAFVNFPGTVSMYPGSTLPDQLGGRGVANGAGFIQVNDGDVVQLNFYVEGAAVTIDFAAFVMQRVCGLPV